MAESVAVSPARRDEVVDALRRGTVPQAGLDLFAVGMERFERAIDAPVCAARESGDGLGYDIRSFTPDGRPRYIEVKATKLGALTPFYITSAELDFARRHQDEYAIYRVFNIDSDTPEFYVLVGDLDTLLAVEPVTYRARPA